MPRSFSLETRNSVWSTQMVVISAISPLGLVQKVGSMLPAAMLCSAVATITTIVALLVYSRMRP